MNRRAFFAMFALSMGCSACCPAAPAGAGSDEALKKIVLLAGPKDHGGPGAHEYEKDLVLLKQCLETSPNVSGVSSEVHVVSGPRDAERLRGAATIVIHSSGDVRADETHAIFPIHNKAHPEATYSEADLRYVEQFDRAMKRGTGIVVLHYSLIVENPRSRSYLLDWIGGYHRSGQSKVKVDRSEATPAKPAHPILRGVRPWTTDHEYYFDQYLPDDKRRVPILTTMMPSDAPQQHVIAWAVEREGGGRGFAFTGGHFHKNMLLDDYRRMILGAILWTAKIPVPEGGVVSSVSQP
jgi:type 1 glutamine amidotransferase